MTEELHVDSHDVDVVCGALWAAAWRAAGAAGAADPVFVMSGPVQVAIAKVSGLLVACQQVLARVLDSLAREAYQSVESLVSADQQLARMGR